MIRVIGIYLEFGPWDLVLPLSLCAFGLLGEERCSAPSESFLTHFGKLLHHFSSLGVLFKKPVDILNTRSASMSNS